MGHSSPKLIASQRLTVSLQPPTTPVFYPTLSILHSVSPPFIRHSFTLSQPLFLFLFRPCHACTYVLLARRRTRHVPATYIVPSNNICPKGREITDFVVSRRTMNAAIDRYNRLTSQIINWSWKSRDRYFLPCLFIFYSDYCGFYPPGRSSMARGGCKATPL